MTLIGSICLLIFCQSGIQLTHSATTSSNIGFSETSSYATSAVPLSNQPQETLPNEPQSTTDQITSTSTSILPNTPTQYNLTTTSSTTTSGEIPSTELTTTTSGEIPSTELTTNELTPTASVFTANTAKTTTEYTTSALTLKTAATTRTNITILMSDKVTTVTEVSHSQITDIPTTRETLTTMASSQITATNVSAGKTSTAPSTTQNTMTPSPTSTANKTASITTTPLSTELKNTTSSPTTITQFTATTAAPLTTQTDMTPSPAIITNFTAGKPSAAQSTAQTTMTQSTTANLSASTTKTVSATKQTTMKSSPTTITNMTAETTKTTASTVQPTTTPSITSTTPSITTTTYFTNGTTITEASTPQTITLSTPETTTTTSRTTTTPSQTTTEPSQTTTAPSQTTTTLSQTTILSTPEISSTDSPKTATASQTSTASTTETTTTTTLSPTITFADSTTLNDVTSPKSTTLSTTETTTTPSQTSTASTTETTATLSPTITFADSTTLNDVTTPKSTTLSTTETTTTPSQTSTASTTETTTTATLSPTITFADSTTLNDVTTPKSTTLSTTETTTTPSQTSTASTTERTTTATLSSTITFADSTTLNDATTPKSTTLSTTETTTTPFITTTKTPQTTPTASYTTEIISTSKTTSKTTTTSPEPTYSSELTSTSTFETSETPNTIVSETTTITMVETSHTSTSSASSTSYTTITAIDCGSVGIPANGIVENPNETSFQKIARFKCNLGYCLNGNVSRVCSVNSSGVMFWSGTTPICQIKECQTLLNPKNGVVNLTSGTTYGQNVSYTCNKGYKLIGDKVRQCQASGSWGGAEPSCLLEEMPHLTCKNDTDTRGTLWTEILANTTRSYDCDKESKGNMSRRCRPEGTWELPQYNCVREAVENVNIQLNNLTTKVNITTEEITVALEALTNVTTTHGTNATTALTDGEITALTSSLENVATLLNNNTKLDSVIISEHFMESASNLLDSSNQESWKAMKESNNNGAETMLKAIDSVGSAMRKSIQAGTGGTSATIIKTNVALEVKKTDDENIEFPAKSSSDNPVDADKDWIFKSHSNLTLDKRALNFEEDKTYITTAIMYRDMSDILPTQSNENATGNGKLKEINGPVLSLSLDLATGNLSTPIRITFGHFLTNLSEPSCNYWAFGNDGQAGGWSTVGCSVNYSSAIQTVCECTHLTNFAVLMSPFVQADADSVPLRIVSIVGIAVSMFCLLFTSSLYICLWRYLRNDRAVILLNLCIALFFSYIVFLAGVDRTESKEFCAVVAALLHYIYLVVFCLMLAEGIDIAYTVLYVFATRSRARSLVIASWVIPAVIVGISLGATQTQGYGNTYFCWLSLSRGVIWAFVAPALLIISLNIICLVLVFRKMLRMKAMESKKTTEKIQTSLRSLCVLVPLMGVSWILGIFYINEDLYFMQYLFAICNGLQGFFIFLFHCALNKKIQNGCQMRRRRMSAMKSTLKTTYRSSSKERSKSKDLKSLSSESRDIDASIDWRNLVLNGTSETDKGRQFNSPIGGGAFGHIQRPTVAFNPPAEYSPHTHDSRQSIKHRDSRKIDIVIGEDKNYDYRRRSTEL
ncbi:mucin-5AC-like isoform X2 [Mya arenaria]|uniref:mucin-5AC-like isoform X2 n=1 Tax=Mya arenaria TaxID=6604 RepID=UPI0022E07875|nr:mucin-5AC-like isoform X2 [Mya arenaria]